jgi:hypothetical protein
MFKNLFQGIISSDFINIQLKYIKLFNRKIYSQFYERNKTKLLNN